MKRVVPMPRTCSHAPLKLEARGRRKEEEGRRAMQPVDDLHSTQYLLKRYWEAALGFWRKDARSTAWLLTIAVFSIAVLNLGLGLLLNIWNRVMFDGLDNRDMRVVLFQSIIFLPLVLASLAMAIVDTYS